MSEWVIDSFGFGDSYRVSELCELVCFEICVFLVVYLFCFLIFVFYLFVCCKEVFVKSVGSLWNNDWLFFCVVVCLFSLIFVILFVSLFYFFFVWDAHKFL